MASLKICAERPCQFTHQPEHSVQQQARSGHQTTHRNHEGTDEKHMEYASVQAYANATNHQNGIRQHVLVEQFSS
jgi:hypothetical protein